MKRILILALALTLCLSLLPACGETQPEAGTPADPSSPATTARPDSPSYVYAEEYQWEGDSGDGMSATEAAGVLYDALLTTRGYIPGELTITMTGFEDIYGSECYRYAVDAPDGIASYAVNYFNSVVYLLRDSGYTVIAGMNADAASVIVCPAIESCLPAFAVP